MTTLKTSHLALLGLLAVMLLNGENIRSVTAKSAATGDRKTVQKDLVKTEKERTRNAAESSKMALDRYRSNCILSVDAGTKKESYFTPGTPVIDTALGRDLRENAPVCNRLGDTAIVTNGVIENIASIVADDMVAFTAILEARGYRVAVPVVEPEAPKPSPSPTPAAKKIKNTKGN